MKNSNSRRILVYSKKIIQWYYLVRKKNFPQMDLCGEIQFDWLVQYKPIFYVRFLEIPLGTSLLYQSQLLNG